LHNKLENMELEHMEIVLFYLLSNAVFMGMDAGRGGGCQHKPLGLAMAVNHVIGTLTTAPLTI
jgi:hypothetical protein